MLYVKAPIILSGTIQVLSSVWRLPKEVQEAALLYCPIETELANEEYV